MRKSAIRAANGIRYTYTRIGGNDTPPLLFLSHFRASIDMWDPGFVERVAAAREVILVDNAGVGRSEGRTPTTIPDMAEHVLAFIDALGLDVVDLLGFSLGGYVAQELALARPVLVRRLVLAGTAPRGTGGDLALSGRTHVAATKEALGPKDLLYLLFPQTETGRTHGIEFIRRLGRPRPDPDFAVTPESWRAQLDSATAWGRPDPAGVHRLALLRQPTLVAHGEHDVMVSVDKARLLAAHLPNAVLKIFPDAGHGFLFQHHTEFADDITNFLGE
ncbi:alpha/beta hydrolase [Amycolatopsis sp. NPDC023774]|uniref:alpha/beta fold hydrolase n=1 Tax=Amycolatopsis sp. NPDC023774 TaxID=3155015 RepID=UPI0033DAA98F